MFSFVALDDEPNDDDEVVEVPGPSVDVAKSSVPVDKGKKIVNSRPSDEGYEVTTLAEEARCFLKERAKQIGPTEGSSSSVVVEVPPSLQGIIPRFLPENMMATRVKILPTWA